MRYSAYLGVETNSVSSSCYFVGHFQGIQDGPKVWIFGLWIPKQKNIIIFIGNKVSSLFKWQKISNATFLLTQQTSARTQTVRSLPHSIANERSTCCAAAFSGREF